MRRRELWISEQDVTLDWATLDQVSELFIEAPKILNSKNEINDASGEII